MKFEHKTFFDNFKPVFRQITGKAITARQVKALDLLLLNFETTPIWSDVRHIAYALATIHIETFVPKTNSRYEPVTEVGGDSYFRKYNGRRDLGNLQRGDGLRFKGRGFVQITGRSNYTKFGIADNPEEALNPAIAFDIMTRGMFQGTFTGKKLLTYINTKKCDYVNARRIINSLDRAKEIASYASRFEKILRASVSTAVPATAKPADPPIKMEENQILPQVSATEQPPEASSQVAENITNVSTGDKTVPDNFVAETKTVDAPVKEGSTESATKITIAGFAVPTILVTIIGVIKSSIEQGFVSAAQIGEMLINFLSANTKYFLMLLGLIIVGLMLKKAWKQISFLLSMWLTADPAKHDVVIKKD